MPHKAPQSTQSKSIGIPKSAVTTNRRTSESAVTTPTLERLLEYEVSLGGGKSKIGNTDGEFALPFIRNVNISFQTFKKS